MLGYKVGVLTESITRTLDLNDDGVVKQPIEECVATTGSPKTSPHSAKPRFEVSIMAPFSYRVFDELEEQIAAAGNDMINSHHDKAHSIAEGMGGAAGDTHSGEELGFKTLKKDGVVVLVPPDTGQAADYPVLTSQPAASIIRLRPNQLREIAIRSIPSWWTRTVDVSIICTGASCRAASAFMMLSQMPARRQRTNRL